MAADLIASYWTIAGNVLPLSGDAPSPVAFQTRVESAANAGFAGMGLHNNDLARLRADLGFAQMRRILEANSIHIVELEAMLDWFADGQRRVQSDAVRALLLEAASELGAYQVKAVADLATDWPFDSMVNEFGELADQVRAAGCRLSLEVMYGTNIADLGRAARLLDSVNAAGTGLMLDIWHVIRGGIPYPEISRLPRSRIIGVELNDGPRKAEGSPIEDTIFRRRFCGEGDFDLQGFIAAVEATGYAGPYGIEVLSDRVRAMRTQECAELACASTRAALAQSRA